MIKSLLFGSFLIDIIFGDPPLLFTHPIALIGKLISALEEFFLNFKNHKISGTIFSLLIITIVFFCIKFLLFIFSHFNNYLNFLLSVILGSFAISIRSLHYETYKVYNALKNGDIYSAQKELSFLVSRDTDQLEENNIIRSLIETISENITDGVIAPLFYMCIFGLPGAFLYKTVNTLDSMIGYKNDKYINFGWFAAKLDDILNFIPARISGILIILSSFILGYNYKNSLKTMLKDRDKTDSPNSGYSEAAFAGALNIQLGGPTPYFGVWHDKPYIGEKIEEISLKHIEKSYRLMYATSILFLLILMVIIK